MKPKLREIEAHPIQHQGEPWVLLRDPLHLTDAIIAVPRPLAPLLAFMDGTRDEGALEAALQVRAGVRLEPGLLAKLLSNLDEACLLDNERSASAMTGALTAYRDAPFRRMSIDGDSFPVDPEKASGALQQYVDSLPSEQTGRAGSSVRGIISPHIDYQRGGPVYAQVWRAAAEAVRDAELVIIFGTDHSGSAGHLTLTGQSYATPWGVLPTDQELVQTLSSALGTDWAFEEELHHRGEHSIELAAVWLHFTRQASPVALLPVLCGHFGLFVEGTADPASYEPFGVLLEVLQAVVASRRTLVVAAADLAHVGPAFGDPFGVDFVGRAQLQSADERLLSCVYAGDATAFFNLLRDERDRRHVCGLPPIYLMLRLLGNASGEPSGYALCPADAHGTSIVSIAGVVLH
jgi:AmmeMemoRadiSam system protein B